MYYFRNLLTKDQSQIGLVFRLGLMGLRTQLIAAIELTPEDPGVKEAQELLNILDALLEELPPLEPQKTNVLEPSNMKLQSLAQELQSDPDLVPYLGTISFSSNNDSQLWGDIQRLFLRLPENLAKFWQQRSLKQAISLGASENKRSLIKLDYIESSLIYPGLKGEIAARGLYLVKKSDDEGTLAHLEKIVNICRKFTESDPCLYHALKSVDRFGIKSLSQPLEKSKYIKALQESWQRVQITANEDNSVLSLQARLDLDEAIHSLIYFPPVDRYSWWGKLQQEARSTLLTAVETTRQQGHKVDIRPLWGNYADIYQWSQDDLLVEGRRTKGEVCACLRVYCQINNDKLPGRVLYYSA